MMHISAGGDRLVFALCVVFTVGALVALQRLGVKLGWHRLVYAMAAVLGSVFAIMLAAGGIDLVSDARSFLGRSFLLCGAVGSAILTGFAMRKEGRQEAELRRVAAHDL